MTFTFLDSPRHYRLLRAKTTLGAGTVKWYGPFLCGSPLKYFCASKGRFRRPRTRCWLHNHQNTTMCIRPSLHRATGSALSSMILSYSVWSLIRLWQFQKYEASPPSLSSLGPQFDSSQDISYVILSPNPGLNTIQITLTALEKSRPGECDDTRSYPALVINVLPHLLPKFQRQQHLQAETDTRAKQALLPFWTLVFK